jgi:hypothetical protein
MIIKQHHNLRRARLSGYDVLPGELRGRFSLFWFADVGGNINSPYLSFDLLKLMAIDLVQNPT